MFKKAERLLTNPTIAIMGPTGSGKTMSALRLANGISKKMGKPFALIDTENGSASLYSHMFNFDTATLSPPFTIEKYIEAVNAAEKGGYSCLVIDSITHAWAGEGGLLEEKGKLDSRPGSNHWTNWNPIKARDQKLRNAYLHSSIPFIIATLRSKMEYAQNDEGGKKKIQKMGMAPVQSDGIEYEFSIVFDVAMNHEAEVSKDRTHLFSNDRIFLLTEACGEKLVDWRNSGRSVEVEVKLSEEKPISQAVQSMAELPIRKPTEPQSNYKPEIVRKIGETIVPLGTCLGSKSIEKDISVQNIWFKFGPHAIIRASEIKQKKIKNEPTNEYEDIFIIFGLENKLVKQGFVEGKPNELN